MLVLALVILQLELNERLSKTRCLPTFLATTHATNLIILAAMDSYYTTSQTIHLHHLGSYVVGQYTDSRLDMAKESAFSK